MSRLRPVLALLTVLPVMLAGLTACSDKKPNPGSSATGALPAGETLLKDSAAAMRDVKTAKFLITADGTIAGLSLKRAQGTLTREGSAQGAAQVTQAGLDVELTFIIVGDKLYLKGPTDGGRAPPVFLPRHRYRRRAYPYPRRARFFAVWSSVQI